MKKSELRKVIREEAKKIQNNLLNEKSSGNILNKIEKMIKGIGIVNELISNKKINNELKKYKIALETIKPYVDNEFELEWYAKESYPDIKIRLKGNGEIRTDRRKVEYYHPIELTFKGEGRWVDEAIFVKVELKNPNELDIPGFRNF